MKKVFILLLVTLSILIGLVNFFNLVYAESKVVDVDERKIVDYSIRCEFNNSESLESCYVDNYLCKGKKFCDLSFSGIEGQLYEIKSSCEENSEYVFYNRFEGYGISWFKKIDVKSKNISVKMDAEFECETKNMELDVGDNIFNLTNLVYNPYRSRFEFQFEFLDNNFGDYIGKTFDIYLLFLDLDLNFNSKVFINGDKNVKAYVYSGGKLDEDFFKKRDIKTEIIITYKNASFETEKILFNYEGLNDFESLNDSCKYCLNPELVLWRGTGNHDKKFDMLVIFENQSEEKIEEYLNATFGKGDFSLFGTKPFFGKENMMNIYYFNTPGFDYTGRKDCHWGSVRPFYLEIFESISKNFDWIDGEIYFFKDPSLWPRVDGKRIYMSEFCQIDSNSNNFAKVFSHEFGHSFGELKDEYIYARRNGLIDEKNCVAFSNSTRWNMIDGYNESKYLGCLTSSSFRGTFNSMMNNQWCYSKSEWFGAWGVINEYYLGEVISKYDS